MAKTSVDLDRDLLRRAGAVLGTRGVRDTIHAALEDAISARHRIELIEIMRDGDRFEFSAAERAWGGDE